MSKPLPKEIAESRQQLLDQFESRLKLLVESKQYSTQNLRLCSSLLNQVHELDRGLAAVGYEVPQAADMKKAFGVPDRIGDLLESIKAGKIDQSSQCAGLDVGAAESVSVLALLDARSKLVEEYFRLCEEYLTLGRTKWLNSLSDSVGQLEAIDAYLASVGVKATTYATRVTSSADQ
jgi:hypothetical protein